MRFIVSAVLSVGLIALGLAAFTACSEPEASVAKIKVPTAQCEACAMTIDKALKKVDGVKEVSVDMEAKVATVTYLADRTDVKKLEQAVVEAGYDANDAKADAAAYAGLPDCCKVKGGHE